MRGLFHFRATPVGAPAPDANRARSVYWFDSVRTEAVLLQLNASPPPCRSTRPGCEQGGLGVLVCLRFAPRRCSYNRTRHRHPVRAPAPGANTDHPAHTDGGPRERNLSLALPCVRSTLQQKFGHVIQKALAVPHFFVLLVGDQGWACRS